MSGFPEEQLELTTQAAWGADLTAAPETWTWYDLTCPHPSNPAQTIPRLLATPITIQRGTAVGASNSQTTSATIQLLNNDGALTPEHPASPYWPYVDAGTPMRLRMRTRTTPYLSDTFTRTTSGTLGPADTGQLYSISGGTADFTTNGSQARIATPTINTLHRMNLTTPLYRDTEVVYDSSPGVVATGGICIIGVVARYVDANNHLWCTTDFQTGGVIQLRVRPIVGGDFGTVITANTATGVTYTAATIIRTRVQVVGDRIRMRVWQAAGAEPTVWHVDVRQQAYTAAGRTGLQTWIPAGVTNTLPVTFSVDNLTISQPPLDRVEGYIADIRPSFLPQPDGTTWSTVLVDIAGVGSRLEKNQSPAYSPLRRSVQLSNPGPVAYWPCEDAEGALTAASAFPGQAPMTVTGPAVFAFAQGTSTEVYLTKHGSQPLVSVAAGARLTGTVPPTPNTGEWAVSVTAELFVTGIPLTAARIMQWDTPGSAINRWAFIGTNTGYLVRAYNDSAGTSTDLAVDTTGAYIGQATYTVEAAQNGANIDVSWLVNDNTVATGSIAGTLTNPTKVVGNPDQVNTTASVDPNGIKFIVGHFRVLTDVNLYDLPTYLDPDTGLAPYAGTGWYQESAHRRINRLCAEERVPFQWVGNPQGAGLTLLNGQQIGGFTDLITEAAESESGGMLYEKRFGYEYLPRTQRYNQAVDLAINMAVYKRSDGTDPGDILVPQLDRRAANYWTISRTNGSSASYAADAAYRRRRGTIAEERTLDVLTDDVLPSHAAWRTHLNVDAVGANYPAIPVDLAANPELIDAWLGCDIGSRVQRTNQPLVAGIGTIDQVIEGITETIAPMSWDVTLAASPGSVWDVGVYDDPATRYDSASTTVAGTPPTTTSPAWTISTVKQADTWSTTATPYNWVVNGEVVTVTVMTAPTGPGPYTQTATVTRSVNGVIKTHTVGEPVHLAKPATYAL